MSNKTTSLTAEQANQMRLDCNKTMELEKVLIRLENNGDFKRLTKHYTEEEASRVVALLAEPSFYMSNDADKYRKDLQERLIGIARFSEYLRSIHRTAGIAQKDLESLDNAEVVME